MTVPTEASRSTYTGNGVTTVFSTVFYFLAQADLKVKLTPSGGVETVQTLGVDYTVTMPAAVGAGGSITMLVAPPAASSLVIERDVAFVQDTSFRQQGTFDRATHEDAMDTIVFQVQELARRLSDLESAGAVGSVVAGNGLSFSGATLHVGAGVGVQVNADDVDVLYGAAPSPISAAAGAVELDPTAAATQYHTHQVLTAAPAAGSVAAGNAAAAGVADTLARSDHVHPVTAPAAPANVTKAAAAAGVSANLAREDHKHDISTAAPVAIGTANSEGTATSLARSDHVHAIGVALETVTSGTVQSTDATPKQALLWTPADNTSEEVDLTVIGRKQGAVDTGGYRRKFTVSRRDGTTALVGTVDTLGADKETNAAWDITVGISSPEVIITVTGAAATTIDWRASARRLVAP